jgi:site-specific DNA-adenine methylase
VDTIHEGGAKFMISYDYREEVQEMYSEYNLRTIDLKSYSGTTNEARLKTRKEYLILNYEPKSQLGIF